jgi:hypothetical protein
LSRRLIGGRGDVSNARSPTRRRTAFIAVVVLVGALTFVSTALALRWVVYAQNVTLTPGDGRGSAYDIVCDRWNDNYMSKSVSGRYGTLAWIRSDGGWQASVKTTEQVMWYTISNIAWQKKLHGLNSSVVTYNAHMEGQRGFFDPGCV